MSENRLASHHAHAEIVERRTLAANDRKKQTLHLARRSGVDRLASIETHWHMTSKHTRLLLWKVLVQTCHCTKLVLSANMDYFTD